MYTPAPQAQAAIKEMYGCAHMVLLRAAGLYQKLLLVALTVEMRAQVWVVWMGGGGEGGRAAFGGDLLLGGGGGGGGELRRNSHAGRTREGTGPATALRGRGTTAEPVRMKVYVLLALRDCVVCRAAGVG